METLLLSKKSGIPEKYTPALDVLETEKAIKKVKDFFQSNLAAELRLTQVTAPLIITGGTGINDDLNGTEKPVSFSIKDIKEKKVEIVQSLAKWKRIRLAGYGVQPGYGIYTLMNALRPDEVLSPIHSVYVDQWDWERVITKEDRTVAFLKGIVRKIFAVLKNTEYMVSQEYPQIKPVLPEEITFIHAEELLTMYPGLSPKEREIKAAEKYGAIFIIGIGSRLADGKVHDGRAPDYDDWITETENGFRGLNGDIILWNPVLKSAFEISSMGIRVDKSSLKEQLKISGDDSRSDLYFHQLLLQDKLPLTIGGGIGQSRACMYFLRKAHIGEIQSSIWPEKMRQACEKAGIFLK